MHFFLQLLKLGMMSIIFGLLAFYVMWKLGYCDVDRAVEREVNRKIEKEKQRMDTKDKGKL